MKCAHLTGRAYDPGPGSSQIGSIVSLSCVSRVSSPIMCLVCLLSRAPLRAVAGRRSLSLPASPKRFAFVMVVAKMYKKADNQKNRNLVKIYDDPVGLERVE